MHEALSLWQGPPLAEFTYQPFAQNAIAQIEELHLAAVEERVEADLSLGHARTVVGELRDLVARHPLRERLHGELMLALYRCGREAEALEVFQGFRRTLSQELGLEPGPGLQQLELAILTRDPALDVSGATLAPEPETATTPARSDPSARIRHHRFAAAASAAVLALVVVAAVVASSGGRAPLAVIPGDSVGAVSASGGAIRVVVPLGTSPSSIAAGDGSVWVTNANAGTLSRIDPGSSAVVESVPVGSSPSGVAVGDGAVWVTDNLSQTVSRIDPGVDRVVQTIAVGNAPEGVAVGDGSVWVANSSDGTLTRIDAVSGDVVDTIALGAGATDVVAGAGAVWVSDESGDRVFRVELTAITSPRRSTSAPGRRRLHRRLRVGVGREQPRRDGLADQSADELGHRNDCGRRRRRRCRGGRKRGMGLERVRRDAVDDQPGGQRRGANDRGRQSPPGCRARTGPGVGRRQARRHQLPRRHADGAGHGSRRQRRPLLTQNLYSILPLSYDGLPAYQRVGGSGSVQLVPDLAVSLPSPTGGGTTFTFKLRHGIRYSDGEPLRPEDFRHALERDLILGDTNYGSPFANVIGGAACAARRAIAISPAASSPMTRPTPSRFTWSRRAPRVPGPPDAPRRLAGAGWHTRPRHRPSPDALHRRLPVR